MRECGPSTGGRRRPTAAPPPPHPGSLVVPGRDLRQIGGGEGEGYGLGLHVVLIRPISTRETAAAYTGLLGCDLNSKFFLYKFIEFKD